MISTNLVDIDEMARILKVSKSWLYQRTRLGQNGIPHIKVGKYIRFDPQEVLDYLKNKDSQDDTNAL